jgi:hypothetical protein
MKKGIRNTLAGLALVVGLTGCKMEKYLQGTAVEPENVSGWVNAEDYQGKIWDAYMGEKNLARSMSNWKKYQNLAQGGSLPDFNKDGCAGYSGIRDGEPVLNLVCESDYITKFAEEN